MGSHNYSPSQQIGFRIEDIACRYLEKNRLVLMQKNFRTRFGEIDLIMKEQDKQRCANILVFIEVRYRKTIAFGGALESIHFGKQKKLINTAQIYLAKYYKHNVPQCRFDVVLVSGELARPTLEWIVNAFECY